jgi:hypothetical protein
MRTHVIKLSAVLAFVAFTAYTPAAAPPMATSTTGPALQSIGPLTFGADGTLFAADTRAAAIFALDLGAQADGAASGTAAVPNIDQKIAAMLGAGAGDIAIADLKVHPRTHNSYVSVMRGQGPSAKPALIRVDGAGKLTLVSTESLQFTSVTLPNPQATSGDARNDRSQAITQLAFTNGHLFVAGLSNEEFASKLWSIGYPFTKADRGTSVEIYHGNHQQLETRAPIYAFIPYTINNQPYLIASYTCTPLVKFPIGDLKPGQKYRGTTIGEMGAGNRPLDMIIYKKNGAEFLLMANTSRGVMKASTAPFVTGAPITTPVVEETKGVPYTTVASLNGTRQLDLLDATHAVVIQGSNSLNLATPELP